MTLSWLGSLILMMRRNVVSRADQLLEHYHCVSSSWGPYYNGNGSVATLLSYIRNESRMVSSLDGNVNRGLGGMVSVTGEYRSRVDTQTGVQLIPNSTMSPHNPTATKWTRMAHTSSCGCPSLMTCTCRHANPHRGSKIGRFGVWMKPGSLHQNIPPMTHPSTHHLVRRYAWKSGLDRPPPTKVRCCTVHTYTVLVATAPYRCIVMMMMLTIYDWGICMCTRCMCSCVPDTHVLYTCIRSLNKSVLSEKANKHI